MATFLSACLYLILEREFLNQPVPVFKIGRSRNFKNRAADYPKGSCILKTTAVNSDSVVQAEKDLISLLKAWCTQRLDIGKEYFQGDYRLIVAAFNNVETKYTSGAPPDILSSPFDESHIEEADSNSISATESQQESGVTTDSDQAAIREAVQGAIEGAIDSIVQAAATPSDGSFAVDQFVKAHLDVFNEQTVQGVPLFNDFIEWTRENGISLPKKDADVYAFFRHLSRLHGAVCGPKFLDGIKMHTVSFGTLIQTRKPQEVHPVKSNMKHP
jgi:hypothetical protein